MGQIETEATASDHGKRGMIYHQSCFAHPTVSKSLLGKKAREELIVIAARGRGGTEDIIPIRQSELQKFALQRRSLIQR